MLIAVHVFELKQLQQHAQTGDSLSENSQIDTFTRKYHDVLAFNFPSVLLNQV